MRRTSLSTSRQPLCVSWCSLRLLRLRLLERQAMQFAFDLDVDGFVGEIGAEFGQIVLIRTQIGGERQEASVSLVEHGDSELGGGRQALGQRPEGLPHSRSATRSTPPGS